MVKKLTPRCAHAHAQQPAAKWSLAHAKWLGAEEKASMPMPAPILIASHDGAPGRQDELSVSSLCHWPHALGTMHLAGTIVASSQWGSSNTRSCYAKLLNNLLIHQPDTSCKCSSWALFAEPIPTFKRHPVAGCRGHRSARTLGPGRQRGQAPHRRRRGSVGGQGALVPQAPRTCHARC